MQTGLKASRARARRKSCRTDRRGRGEAHPLYAKAEPPLYTPDSAPLSLTDPPTLTNDSNHLARLSVSICPACNPVSSSPRGQLFAPELPTASQSITTRFPVQARRGKSSTHVDIHATLIATPASPSPNHARGSGKSLRRLSLFPKVDLPTSGVISPRTHGSSNHSNSSRSRITASSHKART